MTLMRHFILAELSSWSKREGRKSGLIDMLLAGDSACTEADVRLGFGGSLPEDSEKEQNRAREKESRIIV
jgi:hypothetical protein